MKAFDAAPPTRPALRRHASDDPDRRKAEAFSRVIYRQRDAAQVRRFAPELAGLRDERGAIVAAAGYCAAASGSLYLERHPGSPVERLLGGIARARPSRERLVEVGHLAGAKAGGWRSRFRRN